MSFFTSFIVGVSTFHFHRFFPFSAAALAIALFLLCLRSGVSGRPLRGAAIQCAVLIVAVASGFLYARDRHVPTRPADEITGEMLTLTVRPRAEGTALATAVQLFSQYVRVMTAQDSSHVPVDLREVRLISEMPLSTEEDYLVKGYIPRDAVFMNPGSAGGPLKFRAVYVKALSQEPSAAAAFRALLDRSRSRINSHLRERFSDISAPFLMSQVTGDRSLLSAQTKNAFNATGLAHLLSISGTHFGLLMFFLFAMFKALFRRLPNFVLVRMTNYITPSQTAAVFSLPFVAGYLGISDMSIPAIRSFIMITLFLLGLLVQRRGVWLNTLLCAACIILLMEPSALLDLSFQLSFIAVLCIGIAAEGERKVKGRKGHDADPVTSSPVAHDTQRRESTSLLKKCLSLPRSALLVSLAAALGTAPLVAYHFHYLSLISPLSNLVITPLVGFVILPLALISSFLFLLSGYFPFEGLLDSLTAALLSAISAAAQFRFAAVPVAAFPPVLLITFYAGLLLFVWSVLRSLSPCSLRALKVVAVLTALTPFLICGVSSLLSAKHLRVTYLDVGQGDASVVETPDGRVFVIDTGRTGLQVEGFLRYRGIDRIDSLMLSHSQADHSGGVERLINVFTISEVWHNGRMILPRDLSPHVPQRSLQRGDVVAGQGYRIIVYHPYEGFYTADPRGSEDNNASLVLKIEGRRQSFLFPGDVETEAEEDLAHFGQLLKSSVLKVPHHGSASSLSRDFLDVVSPEVAVISLGRGNVYGFPHRETLDKLEQVRLLVTGRDGAVGARESEDGGLVIKTWKESRLSEAAGFAGELLNLRRIFSVW